MQDLSSVDVVMLFDDPFFNTSDDFAKHLFLDHMLCSSGVPNIWSTLGKVFGSWRKGRKEKFVVVDFDPAIAAPWSPHTVAHKGRQREDCTASLVCCWKLSCKTHSWTRCLVGSRWMTILRVLPFHFSLPLRRCNFEDLKVLGLAKATRDLQEAWNYW